MKRNATRYIFVHCSATPSGRPVTVEEITSWHQARGFKTIGYHFVIHQDGKVEHGRAVDVVGAHARGYNISSIGICLIGGVSANNVQLATADYTPAQMEALKKLVKELTMKYPRAEVLGHRDVENGKTCPNFNVRKWWKENAGTT